MKLTKLKINSHYHLKDVEFDFTYPKGHKKYGQPLDKICFIGQSATGKTRILNLIHDLIGNLLDLEIVGNSLHSKWGNQKKNDADVEFKIDKNYFKLDNKQLTIFNSNRTSINHIQFLDNASGSVSQINFGERKNVLINFTSDILSKYNLSLFDSALIDYNSKTNFLNTKEIIDFKDEFDVNFIYSLLKLNIEHNKKYDSKIKELFDSGLAQNLDSLMEEMKIWNKKNVNPIDEISDKLSSVFRKLFIEIDKTNVKKTISFRDIRTNDSIPLQNLSTGTKSLLLYLIPLFLLKPKDSVILFDEPERSLFPDIQINLIDYFKEFTGNSQLIVATHSPFIASSFEPEERFILYFDDEGNVKVKRGISPIGDDPNDILKNDFDTDYINDFGKKAFEKYLELKRKINLEENQDKKEELISKYEELGDKYNF